MRGGRVVQRVRRERRGAAPRAPASTWRSCPVRQQPLHTQRHRPLPPATDERGAAPQLHPARPARGPHQRERARDVAPRQPLLARLRHVHLQRLLGGQRVTRHLFGSRRCRVAGGSVSGGKRRQAAASGKLRQAATAPTATRARSAAAHRCPRRRRPLPPACRVASSRGCPQGPSGACGTPRAPRPALTSQILDPRPVQAQLPRAKGRQRLAPILRCLWGGCCGADGPAWPRKGAGSVIWPQAPQREQAERLPPHDGTSNTPVQRSIECGGMQRGGGLGGTRRGEGERPCARRVAPGRFCACAACTGASPRQAADPPLIAQSALSASWLGAAARARPRIL